jgi:hypothetical protein
MQATGRKDQLVDAGEAVVSSLSNDPSGCFLDVEVTTFERAPKFKFDLKTLAKIYDFDDERSLCENGNTNCKN